MTNVLAALTAAASVAAVVGIGLLFILYPAMRATRQSWGAYGIHLGLALLALGVAFSGPYKTEREVVLAQGESVAIGEFTVTYSGLHEDRNVGDILARATATLSVSKDGREVGVLKPDKRIYKNFSNQQYAEVGTIPSLGDELYATLLGLTQDDRASFKISINPLVNWIWIGGTLMCLLALLLLRRMPRTGEVR
jgi:cytochrome c-type biogenesis protein CcmF